MGVQEEEGYLWTAVVGRGSRQQLEVTPLEISHCPARGTCTPITVPILFSTCHNSVFLGIYQPAADLRGQCSFADECQILAVHLACAGLTGGTMMNHLYFSLKSIYSKKYSWRAHYVSDTLVGMSVENVMIDLWSLLIVNVWVTCSVLHLQTMLPWTFFSYVPSGAHLQEVLLGSESEWTLVMCLVNICKRES